MANYVKLGEKASMFYDPVTQTKILPGQVIKISGRDKFSKKISTAIKGGHLDKVEQSEYKAYMESLGKAENNSTGAEDKEEKKEKVNEDTFIVENHTDFSEEGLAKLSKKELLKLVNYYDTEVDDKALSKYTKQELIDEVIILVEEEEEE